MEATLPRGEDQGLWRQAAQLSLLLVEGSGPSKLSFLICQMDTVTPTLPRSCGDQMRPWGTAAGTCRHSANVNCSCNCSSWSFCCGSLLRQRVKSLCLQLYTRQKRNLRLAWPAIEALGHGEGTPVDSKWLMEAESRSSEGMIQVLPAKQQATAGPRPADSPHRTLPHAWPLPPVLSPSQAWCSEHLHKLQLCGRQRQDASLTPLANFTI